jgi:Sulfotransferase family
VIWMRRDPLDCAWSAFRTYFVRGVAWSWSLTDIANHFKIEDQLCESWQKQLGKKLMVINYEDLVKNPDIYIKQIAAHCGLEFENQMLNPEKVQRPVTTASVAQVRQPMNTSGIDASEPYRDFMKPFIDAYY